MGCPFPPWRRPCRRGRPGARSASPWFGARPDPGGESRELPSRSLASCPTSSVLDANRGGGGVAVEPLDAGELRHVRARVRDPPPRVLVDAYALVEVVRGQLG